MKMLCLLACVSRGLYSVMPYTARRAHRIDLMSAAVCPCASCTFNTYTKTVLNSTVDTYQNAVYVFAIALPHPEEVGVGFRVICFLRRMRQHLSGPCAASDADGSEHRTRLEYTVIKYCHKPAG